MKVKTLNKKIKTLIKNLVIISIEMYIQDSWRTEIARLNIFKFLPERLLNFIFFDLNLMLKIFAIGFPIGFGRTEKIL